MLLRSLRPAAPGGKASHPARCRWPGCGAIHGWVLPCRLLLAWVAKGCRRAAGPCRRGRPTRRSDTPQHRPPHPPVRRRATNLRGSASLAPQLARRVPGQPPEGRGERPRRAIAQVRRHARHRLALAQARHGGEHPCLLPPQGKAGTELRLEQARQGARRRPTSRPTPPGHARRPGRAAGPGRSSAGGRPWAWQAAAGSPAPAPARPAATASGAPRAHPPASPASPAAPAAPARAAAAPTRLRGCAGMRARKPAPRTPCATPPHPARASGAARRPASTRPAAARSPRSRLRSAAPSRRSPHGSAAARLMPVLGHLVAVGVGAGDRLEQGVGGGEDGEVGGWGMVGGRMGRDYRLMAWQGLSCVQERSDAVEGALPGVSRSHTAAASSPCR